MLILLAYIPVVHQGYLQLFAEYFAACTQAASPTKKLLLISADLAQEFGPTHKDLHGLPTDLTKQALTSWQLFDEIEVATPELLQQLATTDTALVIPDELITRQIVTKYLPAQSVTLSKIFLRWDSENTLGEHAPEPEETVSAESIIMQQATQVSEQSSDWWRRVGALAVKDKAVIAQAHNTHMPSEQQPYVEGDGRAQFHKGEHIEITTAIHAEAKLIAEAAKTGTSLYMAELYVTDFPCPTCAKLIATAGFSTLYYQKGYAVFDGERILKAAGVKIVQVTS